MLQLVRRTEPLSILREPPPPSQPVGGGNPRAISAALITVLSINVFVISSVAAFCLFVFFFQQ